MGMCMVKLTISSFLCPILKAAKENQKSQLILVKPYFSNELNTNREYYNTFFDDVVIPNELLDVHYKSAIQKRNQWMVDRSEFVIAGVYRDFGGAFQTIQYASKAGKKVVDIKKNKQPIPYPEKVALFA